MPLYFIITVLFIISAINDTVLFRSLHFVSLRIKLIFQGFSLPLLFLYQAQTILLPMYCSEYKIDYEKYITTVPEDTAKIVEVSYSKAA
jgi:hypothetical protein